ncbi:hypothetical protein [Ilyobacter sp.]|uniref:hypothetical protein n=1 Tax=Ilyobacter sp. TaxID=3100343 RepID=UPI003566289B
MASKKGFSMSRDPLSVSKKNNSFITEKYNSIFDYEKFEIIDLKAELIESEEKIYNNSMNIGKATFEIAEELYNVNQKLANRGNGVYMEWCSSLGINKDKSSVLLKKYKLFLETSKREIMELPIPVVKTLTSKNSNFTQEDILEVLKDKKPSLKIKEIEKRYSQVANKKSCGIQEAIIVESPEGKLERELKLKQGKLDFINRDIAEREKNLKKIREEREQILREISEIEKNIKVLIQTI